MTFPRQLLKLKPSGGIIIDVPPYEVADEFWTEGNNVTARESFIERIKGYRDAYGDASNDLSADVWHLLNARTNTTNYWFWLGDDSVHMQEASNTFDVTPTSWSAVDQPYQLNTTLLNGIAVVNNGLNTPCYYAGDTAVPLPVLPNWPTGTTARFIIAFKFHLFAFDIVAPGGDFQEQMLWSDAAEPGAIPSTWTAAAGNEAGDAILADTPGPIMTAAPMRGSLLVYKRSSTYAVDYVGGNDIYSVRTLFSSFGALTRRAVADLNGQHFVVADGDIVLTDGTNKSSPAQGKMKEFLFTQLDQNNYENLFVIYNRSKNDVWVCFPEQGNTFCTKALVYHVSTDTFSVRDLPQATHAAIGVVNDTTLSNTYDNATGTFDAAVGPFNQVNFSLAEEALLVGYTNKVRQYDTQDLVEIESYVAKTGIHFGLPERIKAVKRVHVRHTGTVRVSIGSQMTAEGSITYSDETTLEEGEQIANIIAPHGRYIAIRIRGEGSDPWSVSGVELEADVRGYF